MKHIWLSARCSSQIVPSGQTFIAQSQLGYGGHLRSLYQTQECRGMNTPLHVSWLLKNRTATSKNIPCRSQCCLQGRLLPSGKTTQHLLLLTVFSDLYLLLCGPGCRSESSNQSIWNCGPDPHALGMSGVLLWTNPVDWTSLSSRRAVLEHFALLVPCVRKLAPELWGCSAGSTKTRRVGTVSFTVRRSALPAPRSGGAGARRGHGGARERSAFHPVTTDAFLQCWLAPLENLRLALTMRYCRATRGLQRLTLRCHTRGSPPTRGGAARPQPPPPVPVAPPGGAIGPARAAPRPPPARSAVSALSFRIRAEGGAERGLSACPCVRALGRRPPRERPRGTTRQPPARQPGASAAPHRCAWRGQHPAPPLVPAARVRPNRPPARGGAVRAAAPAPRPAGANGSCSASESAGRNPRVCGKRQAPCAVRRCGADGTALASRRAAPAGLARAQLATASTCRQHLALGRSRNAAASCPCWCCPRPSAAPHSPPSG